MHSDMYNYAMLIVQPGFLNLWLRTPFLPLLFFWENFAPVFFLCLSVSRWRRMQKKFGCSLPLPWRHWTWQGARWSSSLWLSINPDRPRCCSAAITRELQLSTQRRLSYVSTTPLRIHRWLRSCGVSWSITGPGYVNACQRCPTLTGVDLWRCALSTDTGA